MLVLIRTAAALLGGIFFCRITFDLLDGQITYSIRETTDIYAEQVTSKSLPEALSVWLMFSALFVGLIIFGVKPGWYAEKPWLLKTLGAAILVGYLLGSLLR